MYKVFVISFLSLITILLFSVNHCVGKIYELNHNTFYYIHRIYTEVVKIENPIDKLNKKTSNIEKVKQLMEWVDKH